MPLEQVTAAHFDKYFGINVKGTLFTVQKALPLMTGGGAIVINGSMASVKGIAGFGVYAATKAALRSFARTWAVDLKGRNIRVNVIAPGMVVTPGYKTELGLTDEQLEAFAAQAAAATPLGRTGTPDEIAKVVAFLASDEEQLHQRHRALRRRRGSSDLITSWFGSASCTRPACGGAPRGGFEHRCRSNLYNLTRPPLSESPGR